MKTITTPQGKIMVDESAEIKEGIPFWGYCWNWFDKINHFPNGCNQSRGKVEKIIATINHSISLDVAMVIVEDEIEKDFQLQVSEVYEGISKEFFRVDTAREWHKKGYKAARVYSDSEMIQSLNQEPIELEMEEVYGGETLASASGFALKTKPVRTIKTTRVDGQLMAYLKS